MKILTLNFLTCARKTCKTSPAAFPLHPRDAELEIVEMEFNPLFIRNILPRVEWDALKGLCTEVHPPSPSDSSFAQSSPIQIILTSTLNAARSPKRPRASARTGRAVRSIYRCDGSGRRRERGTGREAADAADERPAQPPPRDDDTVREVGVWELRARVRDQRGHRELSAAESYGVKEINRSGKHNNCLRQGKSSVARCRFQRVTIAPMRSKMRFGGPNEWRAGGGWCGLADEKAVTVTRCANGSPCL